MKQFIMIRKKNPNNSWIKLKSTQPAIPVPPLISHPRKQKTGYLKTGWVIALIILILAVFSPWGAIKYYRLENDIEKINSDNLKLRAENMKLREEIEKLTTSPAYIEKIAREEHGLIRNNEVIYQFPKSGKKK